MAVLFATQSTKITAQAIEQDFPEFLDQGMRGLAHGVVQKTQVQTMNSTQAIIPVEN